MEEVIKYLESLEARLAAAETRAAAAEARVAECEARLKDDETKISNYESRLAALEEAQQTNEAVIASLEAEVEDNQTTPIIPTTPKEEPRDNVSSESRDNEEPAAPTPSPSGEQEGSFKAAIYGKPVDNIRQAISLGDRFLYQRELFAQQAELMQKTLDELDQLNSFEEALNYINAHFQWDTETNTYQQFLVTLHRRFG